MLPRKFLALPGLDHPGEATAAALVEERERRRVVQHVDGDVGVVACPLLQYPRPLPIDNHQPDRGVAKVAGVPLLQFPRHVVAGAPVVGYEPVEAAQLGRSYALRLHAGIKLAFDEVVQVSLGGFRQDQHSVTAAAGGGSHLTGDRIDLRFERPAVAVFVHNELRLV